MTNRTYTAEELAILKEMAEEARKDGAIADFSQLSRIVQPKSTQRRQLSNGLEIYVFSK